jgi:hypothetical protein
MTWCLSTNLLSSFYITNDIDPLEVSRPKVDAPLMPEAIPTLYTLEEAAQTLGCTEYWLATQLRARRFPATKISGRWRMTADDITAAIDICRPGPKPEPEDPILAGLTPIARRRAERNKGAS